MQPLTDKQMAVLARAASQQEGAFFDADMRVVTGLIRRGLVDAQWGKDNFYDRARGRWVTREVITGLTINDKGRAALAASAR